MALTKTARTVYASASLAAGAGPVWGRLDLNSVQGPSRLTIKITNGATGPTTQCTARVLIAHNATLPSAASAGTDWKTLYAPVGPGTGNNASIEQSYPIGPEVMCLEVEFTGNTGQGVTVEAYLSELTTVS
jgi:hypothetical protein